MKVLQVCIFYLWSFGLFAQDVNFENRIKNVDNFSKELLRTTKNISEFKEQLKNYKNPKLIKKDRDLLSEVLNKISSPEQEILNLTPSVTTENIKKLSNDLKKIVQERQVYTDNEKKRKDIEENASSHANLTRYIQSIKQGKYNQAKIILFGLKYPEDGIAEEYSRLNDFLIREEGLQDSLKSDIKSLSFKIANKLEDLEKVVSEIKRNESQINDLKPLIYKLDNELALDQYDFNLDTWKTGMFKCESKSSRYFKSETFPKMIFLKDGDNIVSVIRYSSSAPTLYEIAYACKKKGQFGGCLDNENKEICRLDESCNEKLEVMEANYNRNEFFQSIINLLPYEILLQRQFYLKDKDQFTILKGLDEKGRLGYYTLDELYSMMDPVIAFSQTLVASNPEDYLKKIKSEIGRQNKIAISEISRKSGARPIASKVEDSKTIINYIYTSMATELEVILNNDIIQERAALECGLLGTEREKFCRSNSEWNDLVSAFRIKDEILNLVPGECPRVVFRIKE